MQNHEVTELVVRFLKTLSNQATYLAYVFTYILKEQHPRSPVYFQSQCLEKQLAKVELWPLKKENQIYLSLIGLPWFDGWRVGWWVKMKSLLNELISRNIFASWKDLLHAKHLHNMRLSYWSFYFLQVNLSMFYKNQSNTI